MEKGGAGTCEHMEARGIGSPRTGITTVASSHVGVRNLTRPQEEHLVFFTTEPFLQPITKYL